MPLVQVSLEVAAVLKRAVTVVCDEVQAVLRYVMQGQEGLVALPQLPVLRLPGLKLISQRELTAREVERPC